MQHVQGFRSTGNPDRIAPSRNEDLFEFLGQGRDGYLCVQTQLFENLHRDVELPLASVDQQQLRWVAELAPLVRGTFIAFSQVRRKTPGEDLAHGGVVVVARNLLHLETSILTAIRQTVLEYHHASHVVGSL